MSDRQASHANTLVSAFLTVLIFSVVIGASFYSLTPSPVVANTARQALGLLLRSPPAQGIELTIAVNPSDKPQITPTDQTNGLPEVLGFHSKPRTPDLMPLNYFPRI
jgi:hypothetical protein